MTNPNAASPAAVHFKAIRSTRAFEEIATQIRAELAEGRLAIGSRLPSERALAEQFGVSRNTLREALRSLEHAGLLRLQKGATGGAFICDPSGDAISNGFVDLYHLGTIEPLQLTEARIWLENIIVRVACERATAQDIDDLKANIAAAEEATRSGDFNTRANFHFDFHRLLARMTGNLIMMVVMDGVIDVLRHFVKTIGDYDNSYVLPSRRRFIKHFEARDGAAAAAEMEKNLKHLQKLYLSRIDGVTGVAAARAATTAATAALGRPAPAAAEPKTRARSAGKASSRSTAATAAPRKAASPRKATTPRKPRPA